MLNYKKVLILAPIALVILLAIIYTLYLRNNLQYKLKSDIGIQTQYLKGIIDTDGRYIYIQDPVTGNAEDTYNIVRHAGTNIALAQSYNFVADDALLQKLSLTNKYLSQQMKSCLGDVSIQCIVEADHVGLGGNALSILSFIEYYKISQEEIYLQHAESLAKWLVFTQDRDGRYMYHRYNHTEGYALPNESPYIPGQAVYALSELYKITKKDIYLKSAERGLDWIINVRDIDDIPQDHWTSYAIRSIYENLPNQKYIDHLIKIMDAMLAAQNIDGSFTETVTTTKTSIRAEALLQGLLILKQNKLIPEEELDKYKKAIELAINFQRTRLINENTKFEKQYIGGVYNTDKNFSVRIDYIQHNMSSMIDYLKYINE